MARRQRDYKAEQQRRNELARARGFSSRGQQRRKIERGIIPPIAPQRVRSPKTISAQRQRESRERQATSWWGKAGFTSERQYRTARDRSEDWSALHAGTRIAQYEYEDNAVPGVTKAEYTKAYFQAFVSGPERYAAVRKAGGSAALRRYFVDITGHYSPDEYEARYGPGNAVRRR